MKNLYVGIDLGLKGPHRASVFDPQENRFLDRSFSFEVSFEGFEYLLTRVQKHGSEKEELRLNFIMEPTSSAWMPLSCFLLSRGQQVYRVTTQKSADFRRFISKHAKSDRIDACALAKLPIVDPQKIYELYLPSMDLGVLNRKTRHFAKVTQQAASRKTRIQSLFAMINPGVLEAFGEEKFYQAGRVFLRHFSNPFKVIGAGKEAFFKMFQHLSTAVIADDTLERIYQTSLSTTKIYKRMVEEGTLPFGFTEVEQEIGIELDLLEDEEKKIAELRGQIKELYDRLDPKGHLTTIRGIGETIAPAILGIVGDVSRFRNIKSFRGYFGFVPKKRQSSTREQKGLGIRKAAQRLLKKYLFLAAETARQYDPECAAFYNRLMKKGLHHYQAVCALANKLVGRVYAILKRMQKAEHTCYKSPEVSVDPKDQIKVEEVNYQLRDLNGKPITKCEAREIVQEKFPSKSQKRKEEEAKEEQNRNSKRESRPSQKSLSDQPRQFFKHPPDNSSMRRGEALPLGTILKNTFPELILQSQFEAEQRDSPGVDNVGKGGGKATGKNA